MAESILFNIVEKKLVYLGQHALQDLISSWGARRDLEKPEISVFNQFTCCEGLWQPEELRINKCEDLDTWDETDGISAWEGMKSLRTLHLSDISKLELLPHGIGGLSKLQHLTTTSLSNLTELPQQIGSLSQLHSLAIFYCRKLTSLPDSFRGLKSLRELKIIGCPDLRKKCQQPDEDDWPLIRHIPSVSFQLFP